MKRRRTGRILAIVLGGLLLLALGFFAFLFTDPGERMLQRAVVSGYERSTSETIAIGRLEFHGDRIVLHDVKARAFGADVAEIDLALASLLGRGVKLDRLALTGYWLDLQRAPDGSWNLPRGPPQPARKPSKPMAFAVDALALRDGVLELRTGGLQLRIEGVAVTGAMAQRNGRWTGDVALNGQVTSPRRVPLSIAAAAKEDGRTQTAKIEATAGEARLHADVQLPGTAQLDLAIPAFDNAGFTYGPVRVAGRIDGDQSRVDALHIEVPGVVAERDASPGGAFSATVKIADLATATRAIDALVGKSMPALAGSGELHVRFEQALTSGPLAVDGTFPALQGGGVQAREVKLEGRLADLTRPGEGQLTATAGSAQTGGRDLRGVTLKVKRDPSGAVLDAAIAQPVAASAHGEVKDPGGGKPLKLEQLVLAYPEATWKGGGKAVGVGDKGVVIDALELASGPQKIAVQGAWGETQKHFTLALTAVRLESLPSLLLPPDLKPGGQLDGELKVSQPGGQLQGAANVTLSDARVAGFTGLNARFDARLAADRVDGSLSGKALEGTVTGRFNIPLSAKGERQLAASFTLEGASLAGAWSLIEGRLPKGSTEKVKNPAGRLSGKVELAGSWAEPKLQVRFALDDGAVTVEGAQRLTGLTVRGDAEATRLQIRLSHLLVGAQPGKLEASGGADRSDPSRPFQYHLEATAERFPLPLEQGYLATFKASLSGAASAERITSKVSITSMRLERAPKPGAAGPVTHAPASALGSLFVRAARR